MKDILDLSSHLTEETKTIYLRAVDAMQAAGVEFLVGGAYAIAPCTGIIRHTKDFDVFVRPADAERTLTALSNAGFETEMTFPHWLAKGYAPNGDFIDVIFSSGNGVANVDEQWFTNARTENVLGRELLVVPVEESLWSKCFIIERERCDSADVAHLLRSCAADLDWKRLLARFDGYWRVLFTHLVLFGFIYPSHRDQVPAWVMRELMARLDEEVDAPAPRELVCRGTLISREQYLTDVHRWGYRDARLDPKVKMTEADIEHWTRAIYEPDHAPESDILAPPAA